MNQQRELEQQLEALKAENARLRGALVFCQHELENCGSGSSNAAWKAAQDALSHGEAK